jgi:hypothetical protein
MGDFMKEKESIFMEHIQVSGNATQIILGNSEKQAFGILFYR